MDKVRNVPGFSVGITVTDINPLWHVIVNHGFAIKDYRGNDPRLINREVGNIPEWLEGRHLKLYIYPIV